ncbi:MAG: arylsulfatase [Actinobacteria bacterium]|nr:arylsulfatase [Actinomycetota bacterium]
MHQPGDATHRETSWGGRIGRTVPESQPDWPPLDLPKAGTPDVVLIVLDDVGFGHLSCYGGEVPTPNMDRLAAGGLRYTNFHTTALCSPTRASMLTGRNHHSVGMRALANFDTGFPNMRGYITPSAATVAEVLQARGHSTMAVGKWHLAPMRDCSPAGPFTHWPLGRGFDRFYGFLQGETDQFHPELCHDNHFIDPPRTHHDGYHLSEDLVDQASRMIRNSVSLVPERPIFCYLAFGAMHSPHQAPAEYLAKWRGRFDEGWDTVRARVYQRQLEMGIIPPGTELAPRNPGVNAWDKLNDDERLFAARLQDTFAAFLDHTDVQIGRLIDFLEQIGRLDNTLLMLMSDNGASQEGLATGVFDEFRYFNGIFEDVGEAVKRIDDLGTIHSHCNYPWGWAQVGNTPSKRYKQNTHGGGVRDPFIVHWPAAISDRGAIRTQFQHVTDITPTILDVLGHGLPSTVKGIAQMPLHGVSMRPTFAVADRPTDHVTQYFEMQGSRGIFHDGWKAVTFHPRAMNPDSEYPDSEWELYHLDVDFSECNDLAGAQPDKLRQLVELWWSEAGKYNVLPLDNRMNNLFMPPPLDGTPRRRDLYVYHPPIDHLSSDVCPPLGSRSWTMTFDLDHHGDGALLAIGTPNSGHVAYVLDGHVVYDVNYFGSHQFVRAAQPLPTGSTQVMLQLERVRRGPGRLSITVDGKPAGQGLIEDFAPMISSTGMDLGSNPSAVSPEFKAPFAFKGTIRRVEIAVERALDQAHARAEAIIAERAAHGLD